MRHIWGFFPALASALGGGLLFLLAGILAVGSVAAPIYLIATLGPNGGVPRLLGGLVGIGLAVWYVNVPLVKQIWYLGHQLLRQCGWFADNPLHGLAGIVAVLSVFSASVWWFLINGPVMRLPDVDGASTQERAATKRDDESLLTHPGSEDWEQRLKTVQSLRLRVKDERQAIDALISMLDDPHPKVRKAVTDMLGDIGTPAIHVLIGTLRNRAAPEDESKRCNVGIEELFMCRLNQLKTGVDELADTVTPWPDEPAIIDEAAIAALANIGKPAIDRVLRALGGAESPPDLRRFAGVLVRIGAPAVEPLTATLQNAPLLSEQWKAAYALGSIGAPAVEKLVEAMSDEEPYAACALGLTKDSRAVEPLIVALTSPGRDSEDGQGEAVEHRNDADEWSYFRVCIADSLGKLGDRRGIEPLLNSLKSRPSGRLAKDLTWKPLLALAKFGVPAVEPLLTLLRDRDPRIRSHAAFAL